MSPTDIADRIGRAIVDDPPITLKDGFVIRDGLQCQSWTRSASLVTGSREYLAGIESRERERTGIKNLRIGYNKVFGYYIEVTKSNLELVPADYIRKQTLSTGERYITEELKDLEGRILTASEKMLTMESELFRELREFISRTPVPHPAHRRRCGPAGCALRPWRRSRHAERLCPSAWWTSPA